MNINLKSIKKESVKSVFSAIASGRDVSRSTISSCTGLSLMTVGKVVEMLEEKGIVIHAKENKNEVGRKAALSNLNNNNFMAIFDLSYYDFELGIFNLSLTQTRFYKHVYNASLSYSDNIAAFLKECSFIIEKEGNSANFMGSAIAIPGVYLEEKDRPLNKRIPELNEIPIKELFIHTIGKTPLIIEENVKLGATAHITNIPDRGEQSVFYIHIGEGVSGAYFVNGELLRGNSPFVSQIGQMEVDSAHKGISVEQYMLSDAYTKSEKTSLLINVIHNIVWLLAPHVVIIESDKEIYNITTEDVARSFDFDKRTFPEIVSTRTNMKDSVGASIKLREIWLEKILFGEEK